MSKVRVSASILAADLSRLGDEVRAVTQSGADCIHVDIIDGHFAPNISFGSCIVDVARKFSVLPIETHLMVLGDLFLADYLIPSVARAGSDTIIVHIERCLHIERMLQRIRSLGKRAGVALNPATPLISIVHLLDVIDYLLIMTVNPGFAGQSFIHPMVVKITEAKTIIGNRSIDLAVDGGVNKETSALVRAAGADIIVAASAIFDGTSSVESYSEAIRDLKGL